MPVTKPIIAPPEVFIRESDDQVQVMWKLGGHAVKVTTFLRWHWEELVKAIRSAPSGNGRET